MVRAGSWRNALFFTYSLSLGFFEGVLLPPLRRGGLREARIFADVHGVADALSESGAREVGRAYAVHPVQVRGSGIFHPKVMLLEGDDVHLTVGSGNLTFGGYGTNLEVIEHLFPSAHPACFADMANLIEEVVTSPRLAAPDRETLEPWVDRLRRASGGVEEGAVRVVHNFQRSIADQLVEFAGDLGGAVRLLIASPYFGSADAVQALADRLSVAELSLHVPAMLPLNGEVFSFQNSPASQAVVIEALEAASGGRPEHLKFIEIECARGTLVLSGSVNASAPALSVRQNIEVGVVRLLVGRSSTLSHRPHNGEKPSTIEFDSAIDESWPTSVLQANVVGSALNGVILGAHPHGHWMATVDSGGRRSELGVIDADESGAFAAEFQTLETLAFGAGRAVLILEREGRRAKGFLTFVDMIGLTKRIGASAGSLVRLAAGSTDDDDLATVLEWFAMNPDESLSPWRSSNGENQEHAKPRNYLPVELLDVGLPTQPGRPVAQVGNHGAGGAALDRLLQRLRGVFTAEADVAAAMAAATDHLESEDVDPLDTNPRNEVDPVVGTFDRLWDVLRDRVPLAPRSELARMLEIGAHVLTRRAAPLGRVQRFISEWSALAVSFLLMEAPRDDLDETALFVMCLAAALDGGTMAGRRRLLHFLGTTAPMDETLAAAELRCWPSVKRLAAHCMGRDTLDDVIAAICADRCAFDDIMELVAAVRDGRPFPELFVLSEEPEIGRLRARIGRNRLERVYVVDGPVASCPKDHRALPTAQFYRLQGRGLATAECCDAILINRRP
jgi:hypothetical protein